MPVYRCKWCGLFYTSTLPESHGCYRHQPEANAELQKSIEKHNAQLAAAPPPGDATPPQAMREQRRLQAEVAPGDAGPATPPAPTWTDEELHQATIAFDDGYASVVCGHERLNKPIWEDAIKAGAAAMRAVLLAALTPRQE